MVEVVKRDGMIIDFDLTKICEAMKQAFKALCDTMEKEVERISRYFSDLEDRFKEWIAQILNGFIYRINARFDPVYELRLSACTLIIIRICTAVFQSFIVFARRKHLMRPQHRGTDKNSECDYYCMVPASV